MKLKTGILLAAFAVAVGFTGSLKADGPAIGKAAPDFTLTDIQGKSVKLSDYKGKYVVLEWTNYGCPFVAKHYDSGNMQALQKKWTDKGVVWLSICSSAKGKEGSMSAADWKTKSAEHKAAGTAILLDESGTVGKSYGAKTTPHMFVIDPSGTLIYKGAIDDKPTYKQADVKGAKNYVDAALTESMGGKPVSMNSTESYGCSVKYGK